MAAKKRTASSSSKSPAKKVKTEDKEGGGIDGLDVPESMEDTPLAKLYAAMLQSSELESIKYEKDSVVVYWMR